MSRQGGRPPEEGSPQKVNLAAWRPGRGAKTIATGETGTNILLDGAGMFRAAMHDDPFFFDAIGYMRLADDGAGTFPRPVGEAANFFGPDVNTLAIIIEMPTVDLLETVDRPILRAWTRTINARDQQVHRSGQPFLNQFAERPNGTLRPAAFPYIGAPNE